MVRVVDQRARERDLQSFAGREAFDAALEQRPMSSRFAIIASRSRLACNGTLRRRA